MGQVNGRRESRALERILSLRRESKVHRHPRKTGEFLGFSVPISRRRDCPQGQCWRRERNCRQTLSFAISMSYAPHKLRWMLTGESWPQMKRAPTSSRAPGARLRYIAPPFPLNSGASLQDMSTATAAGPSSSQQTDRGNMGGDARCGRSHPARTMASRSPGDTR
jgi:hypothetical protein